MQHMGVHMLYTKQTCTCSCHISMYAPAMSCWISCIITIAPPPLSLHKHRHWCTGYPVECEEVIQPRRCLQYLCFQLKKQTKKKKCNVLNLYQGKRYPCNQTVPSTHNSCHCSQQTRTNFKVHVHYKWNILYTCIYILVFFVRPFNLSSSKPSSTGH